jgi:hypothetical protein
MAGRRLEAGGGGDQALLVEGGSHELQPHRETLGQPAGEREGG